MIPQESPVFVPWNGKMLQGSLISENYMMGMTAVRIPLQGCHPVALFAPAHVILQPKEAESGISPEIFPNPPKVSGTTKCEAFKKSHWDHAHNHLMIDALNEFYSLWKMEHTPSETPPPSPQAAALPLQKAPTPPKKPIIPIQLSLFE